MENRELRSLRTQRQDQDGEQRTHIIKNTKVGLGWKTENSDHGEHKGRIRMENGELRSLKTQRQDQDGEERTQIIENTKLRLGWRTENLDH